MANQRAARRYATAIFTLAKEGDKIEKVASDLESIRYVLESDQLIQRFFLAPVIARNEKAQVFLESFEHRIDETTLHALLLIIQKRREALLPEIVAEYQSLVLAERALEPLILTSARALQPDELSSMVARLSALYGKQFAVQQDVDSSLIGGVRVSIGDRRIDGSIAGRLDDFAMILFSQS